MNVFLTGATGYIGKAVAEALTAAGHSVTGLVRPERDARPLAELGIRPFPGRLQNPDAVAAEAARADAVIHTAFDWTENGALADEAFIEAVLAALAGSSKAFIYTSGVWVMGNTKKDADEESPVDPPPIAASRLGVERKVIEAAALGIRSVVIRPATVYGRGGGLAMQFLKSARETGTAIVPGTGENYWTFVHVDDLADLYVLALDAAPGSLFVAASGTPLRLNELARAASEAAGAEGRTQSWVTDEALLVFGPAVQGLLLDQRVSGRKAERVLGWKPKAPSVLEELRRKHAVGR